MNLRTSALAAVALIAFGTSAVSFAQTAPGPQTTPPPPPVPNTQVTPVPTSAPEPLPSAVDTSTPGPAPTATPVPEASPTASPESQPRGRGRGRAPKPAPSPSPTDTPEPPQFSNLDGVWEVALQPLNAERTIYSHLYIKQAGSDLTGHWLRDKKTDVPITGTFDGRVFTITAKLADSTVTFRGYEENYSDMVGLFTDGNAAHPGIPFTAAHRARAHEAPVVR